MMKKDRDNKKYKIKRYNKKLYRKQHVKKEKQKEGNLLDYIRKKEILKKVCLNLQL